MFFEDQPLRKKAIARLEGEHTHKETRKFDIPIGPIPLCKDPPDLNSCNFEEKELIEKANFLIKKFEIPPKDVKMDWFNRFMLTLVERNLPDRIYHPQELSYEDKDRIVELIEEHLTKKFDDIQFEAFGWSEYFANMTEEEIYQKYPEDLKRIESQILQEESIEEEIFEEEKKAYEEGTLEDEW